MTMSFQGFRSLIENNPDPISLVDAAGKTVYGNASATKLFGYRPEELVGRTFLELIHSEDRDRSSRMLQEVITNPSDSLQWDARVCGKDGNCSWVESTVFNLLFDPEVSAIVVQQRNVNVRRASEVKRKQKAEELARSNLRLEEFAYTAAHDLREPLRAISLYTQMLIHDVPMDAKAEQKAQFVVDGATRMSALVDDLLAFANTGAQQSLQSVDLGHAAAEAIRNLAPSIEAASRRSEDRSAAACHGQRNSPGTPAPKPDQQRGKVPSQRPGQDSRQRQSAGTGLDCQNRGQWSGHSGRAPGSRISAFHTSGESGYPRYRSRSGRLQEDR